MAITTLGRARDFIQFSRASNATVTDSDGKIKWAPHNLLLNSESFDAAAWTKVTATITANAIASPNGTTTADKFISTNTNTGEMYQNISKEASAITYTTGVFAKAGGFNWLQIAVYDGASTGSRFWFNLSTGAKGSTAAIGSGYTSTDYNIVSIGDGWYYCWVKATTNTGTTNRILFYPANADNTFTAGNGTDGVHLWGAHLYRSDLGGMQSNTSAYPMYNPTTPKNLLGYSEAFDVTSSGWIKSGLAATPVIANAIAAPNGSLTADKIVENSSASTHYIAQSAGTLQTSPYTFTVYAKAAERSIVSLGFDGLNAWFNLSTGVKGTAEAGLTSDMVSVGDGWYRCWVRRTVAVSGLKSCSVYIANADNVVSYTGDGTSGIYLWGAQLSDSASLDPYVPVFGAAPSAAAYHGPRLDYDPVTLSARGLLVEEQRSNSLTYSQEFDNGAWLKGVGYNSTVSANTSAAPDNTTTADSVLADSAGGTGNVILARSVAVTSGTSYTLTFFAKAGTLSWIRLFALGYTSPGNGGAYFNLSGAGAVGTVDSGYTASIAAFGNGWYRCSLSFTAGSSVTGELRLLLANANGDTAVARNGTSSVLVWGAQLEAGSFPTSLIPTGSATATRAADVASVSTQAFPYSASEGTLVVAHDFLDGTSSTTSAYYPGSIGDGQATPYMVMGLYGNGVPFTQVPTTALGTALGFTNSVSKIGLAFTGSSQSGSKDGSAASSSSMTATLSAAGLLRISGPMYGFLNYSGYIRQVTYLPRRISNAELQSRTA